MRFDFGLLHRTIQSTTAEQLARIHAAQRFHDTTLEALDYLADYLSGEEYSRIEANVHAKTQRLLDGREPLTEADPDE